MLLPILHHIDETSPGLFTPFNQAEFDSLKQESVYNFQTAVLRIREYRQNREA
ncbi:MAG: hypothetical protein WCC64_03650 [Aliidongia sp.]